RLLVLSEARRRAAPAGGVRKAGRLRVSARSDVSHATPEVERLPAELSIGESRWPPGLAVLGVLALTVAIRIWLPGEAFLRVPWLVPAIEVVLLAVLLGGNPANVARHTVGLRRLTLTIVVLLVAAALWSTAVLVYDLIQGTGVSNDPSELLATGGLVW